MSDRENQIHWYALKVFFNKVFEVERMLEQDGIESYIPCRYVTSEVKGVTTRIRKTLIPSLMFFRSSEEFANDLQRRLMDRAIVYTNLEKRPNRRPAPIEDREMRTFMLVTSVDDPGVDFFSDDYMDYKSGDRVRVIGGVFEGAEGVVKRIKHNRRLTVTLKGICMVATSFIDPSLLQKIEE